MSLSWIIAGIYIGATIFIELFSVIAFIVICATSDETISFLDFTKMMIIIISTGLIPVVRLYVLSTLLRKA